MKAPSYFEHVGGYVSLDFIDFPDVVVTEGTIDFDELVRQYTEHDLQVIQRIQEDIYGMREMP
jgi:hypothetical protein